MPVTAELPAESAALVGTADRHSRNASLTLALAQPGDTLLYVLLPLHHELFGVSLAGTGLLLAANRLVRIAGYGWVARFYAEHGPRSSCLLAVAGAALATSSYAYSSGIWPLLVARLLWGLSYAAMSIDLNGVPYRRRWPDAKTRSFPWVFTSRFRPICTRALYQLQCVGSGGATPAGHRMLPDPELPAED